MLTWDRRRIASVAAALAALVALWACYWPYWPIHGPRAESFAGLLRYGWTFLGVYVVALLGVSWCLRIVLAEFVEQKHQRDESEAASAGTPTA